MKVENTVNCNFLLNLQLEVSKGNVNSFAKIYNFFYKKLIGFSTNFVKSKELAEEVVEDVFIKLWCNREHLADVKNITVYLYCATKNKSLNALSKEAKSLITESLNDSYYQSYNHNHNPHDLMVSAEVMQALSIAIERLPERCKIIFKLVREDGLRYKEVAQILSISVNTIDSQMAIAVKRLCSELQVEKDKRPESLLPQKFF
ncbi:RNA polymerase sigma-70 factor [Arcticibacter eurypsychrophilus]|uniref:RNA polymerase sigma-70 factor n=1 Tax=Arcticibacter eurypsychrophilus TaxID=1434752 RepID=UPI001B8B28C8|nr:RNA polymerase sigma-70 factor [Arcticibacter eurypsychrophilus]